MEGNVENISDYRKMAALNKVFTQMIPMSQNLCKLFQILFVGITNLAISARRLLNSSLCVYCHIAFVI